MRKSKIFNWGAVLILSLGLGACANKASDKRQRIETRGANNVAPVESTPQPSSPVAKSDGQGKWGEIIAPSNWQQAQFQQQVVSFLSNLSEPDGNPLSLGTVSGLSNQATGIRFYGSVGLSGAFNVNGQNQLTVQSSGSELRIAVVDNYVGMKNAEGDTIKEVPIYIASQVEGFVSVTGVVQGNQALITYEDSFGKIQLQGTFNSNWFTGSVSFANNSAINGGAGQQGQLGVFRVETCGFFKCQ